MHNETKDIKAKKFYARTGFDASNSATDESIFSANQTELVKIPSKEEMEKEDPFSSISDDDFNFDIFGDDDKDDEDWSLWLPMRWFLIELRFLLCNLVKLD